MSQQVNNNRIARFHQDRKLLLSVIDEPVSSAFLDKFYAFFGDELKEIRKKHKVDKKGQDWTFDEINKTQISLENKYYQLLQNHQLIAGDIHRLEQKINEALEKRLEKIEIVLSRLTPQKKPPNKTSV